MWASALTNARLSQDGSAEVREEVDGNKHVATLIYISRPSYLLYRILTEVLIPDVSMIRDLFFSRSCVINHGFSTLPVENIFSIQQEGLVNSVARILCTVNLLIFNCGDALISTLVGTFDTRGFVFHVDALTLFASYIVSRVSPPINSVTTLCVACVGKDGASVGGLVLDRKRPSL